jgi:hypothetical protein
MASFNENLLNSSYDKGTRAVDSTPIGVRVARFPLSEAKNNIPISLTTGNQTMHVCSKTALDEVYLWVANIASATRDLYVSVDDSSYGTNSFVTTIDAKSGLVLVYPGVPHKGVKIHAKASANSSLLVYGFVQRQYPFNENSAFTGYGGTSE